MRQLLCSGFPLPVFCIEQFLTNEWQDIRKINCSAGIADRKSPFLTTQKPRQGKAYSAFLLIQITENTHIISLFLTAQGVNKKHT